MSRTAHRIRHHLHVLVEEVGPRPPGSPSNRTATDYVRRVLEDSGLDVTAHSFVTRWWEPGAGRLETATRGLDVMANPYSRAGDVGGHTLSVETTEQLEALETAAGKVLVLRGDVSREQVMPAAFPFLDLPEHARIRAALHRLQPSAVIAVSDHWQPVLEDPDLDLVSTTVSLEAGACLREDEPVRLVLDGAVHEGSGSTIAARTGADPARVVLSAHLDSKSTTPGAFDNAASVATILAIAEAHALGPEAVEVVLFNGEDHFDACGEVAWLAATELDEVVGNVNLDGAGLAGHRTSLAMLACPSQLERALEAWLARRPGWVHSDAWYESDHAIFAMRGIPALAVTTEDVHQLLGGLAHTPADTLDVLDVGILVELADAVPELLTQVALSGKTAEPGRAAPSSGSTTTNLRSSTTAPMRRLWDTVGPFFTLWWAAAIVISGALVVTAAPTGSPHETGVS